jgi:hypothetical protein
MRKDEAMNLKSAILAAAALAAIGCASAPTETRTQDDQGQAHLALARKLWDRDVLESLRHLRKGVDLRDADCCRQYLAYAETAQVNLSQRVYARLFVEGAIRRGAVLNRSGEDIRGELYYQLCWAWRQTEPRSPQKAKQVLEAMLDSGSGPEQAKSAFILQMIREYGIRAEIRVARTYEIQLMAGETSSDVKRWLQVPAAADRRLTNEWAVAEANAWGGGSDRLFLGTNVLAFLVNAQGEPSFRGNHLWICNLGTAPVYLTSLAVGQNNRELLPGQEEVFSQLSSETTTGIPVHVRHLRPAR